MGLLNIFKSGSAKDQVEIRGPIRYYGLVDWWRAAFSEDERQHMIRTYQPMSVGVDSIIHDEVVDQLTTGELTYSSADEVSFLYGLAGWFNNKRDRQIARRILEKAYEYVPLTKSVLSLHFLYSTAIEIYYPDREIDSEALSKTIQACRDQIALSGASALAWKKEFPDDQGLPAHKGYEQLAIILDKQDVFADAIQLCEQAKKQGWAGDWDRRIERYGKKL